MSQLRSQPRAFVLLIVLMAVTALSVMAMLQADVGVSDRLAAVGVKQDVQARAIAERCLQEAVTYVRHTTNRAGQPDFDRVLEYDPPYDGAWTDTEMFLPNPATLPVVPGTDKTVIHDGATTNRAQALHRFRVVPMLEGACLIRFDDNADDYLAGAGMSTQIELNEGTGVDEPRRDQDRTLVVTAMGIYPYNGNPVGAFQRARSRVTMRSILQTSVTAVGVAQPALTVGGDITGSGRLRVCGIVGGFSHPGPSMSWAGVSDFCTCGDTWAGPSPTPGQCPPGQCLYHGGVGGGPFGALGNDCTPQIDNNAWSPTPITWEWPADLRAAASAAGVPFPTPDAAGPVGGGDVPFVTTQPGGAQFLIGAPALTPKPLMPADVSGPGGSGLGDNGICDFYFGNPQIGGPQSVWYWDHTDPAPATTLAAYGGVTIVGAPSNASCATQPIAPPCQATAMLGTNLDCTNGGSLCWKYAAYMGGSVVGVGGATESTSSSPGTETFKPNSAKGAPYSYNGASLGTPVTWGAMCPGITDDDEDEGVTWTAGTNQWDVQTAQTAGHWGSAGTNWIVQNEGTASTNAFLVSQNLGTSANPIKLRIIAKNNVNLRGSNNFITCPSCTDHTGTCIRTDDPKSAGFAVWTPYGHCYLDNADKWVGDVACRTVMIGAGAGTDCMIADIWGTSQCNGGGGDFDCGAWYSDANVLGETCFQNSQGNVCGQPGICVDPGITVVGDLISHGDIQVRGTATQNVFADKIIASNVGADNSTATRPSVCTYTAKLYADDFIFSAGTLNLTGDNGSRTQSNLYARKVYSLGNIKMWKDHEIRGSDPTGAFGPANDADVYVAGNFDFSSSLIYVHGRMVVGGDFAADSKKIVIRNDGVSAGVTASVTVEEDNIWMEVPW